jgi:predicted DNA-binding transcriptional regulator YafY
MSKNTNKRPARAPNKNTTMKQLALFSMLQGDRFISTMEMAQKLEVNERTVYRYLQPLQHIAGFENKSNTYRINRESNETLISFTEKELLGIRSILQNVEDQQLSGKLLILLSQLFENERISRKILHHSLYKKEIAIIQEAIEHDLKINIGKYISREKVTINRILSPVMIKPSEEKLYALDGRILKTFNLENMKGVTMIKKNRDPHAAKLPSFKEDVFGFMQKHEGQLPVKVVLLMSNFAKTLLVKQFKQLVDFITGEKKQKQFIFRLEIEVYDIQPIARFAAGLLNEVRIEGSDDARRQIKNYITSRLSEGLKSNFNISQL